MFPSKLPWLSVLQMALIVGAVITAILVTGNPLALLALMLMWPAPPIVQNNGSDNEPEIEEGESRPIGFTADLPEE